MIQTRADALINWLQTISLRICNYANTERTARFTNFIPHKKPSTVDYFIAVEHRVDIIKDVTTLQLSDLDPQDALHQSLAQHNHRALMVTLELPIVDT